MAEISNTMTQGYHHLPDKLYVVIYWINIISIDKIIVSCLIWVIKCVFQNNSFVFVFFKHVASGHTFICQVFFPKSSNTPTHQRSHLSGTLNCSSSLHSSLITVGSASQEAVSQTQAGKIHLFICRQASKWPAALFIAYRQHKVYASTGGIEVSGGGGGA